MRNEPAGAGVFSCRSTVLRSVEVDWYTRYKYSTCTVHEENKGLFYYRLQV